MLLRRVDHRLTSKKVRTFKLLPKSVGIHTMMIFERIPDNRDRDVIQITMYKQSLFVNSRGTTDTIHAAQILMEKHCSLSVAFLNLKKPSKSPSSKKCFLDVQIVQSPILPINAIRRVR